MMKLPKDVIFILNKLHNAGFKAYCVGGGVRDLCLNLLPKDFDFTTNALPTQIKKVFKDFFYLEVGEKYGTISVQYRSKFYEITTFRKDINYNDSRRPEFVIFSNDLYTDLSRRDFTVNALAYNTEEGLIDYFNGIEDLNNRIIRAVGTPLVRFNEDALRIMRAIRFAVTYQFSIEEGTLYAMHFLKENLLHISFERLQSEFFKILLNVNFKQYQLYREFFFIFIPELKLQNDENLKIIEYSNKDIVQKLCILFNGLSIDIGEVLKRLKCSNKIIYEVKQVLSVLPIRLTNNKSSIKYFLNKINVDLFRKVVELQKAFSKYNNDLLYFEELNNIENLLSIILKNNESYMIKDLKVDGQDLINLGFKKGPIIKKVLLELLDEVINNPEDNEYDYLINIAKTRLHI